MTNKQLSQAHDLARIETDLELAAMTGEVTKEFADKLRIVLMRGNELNLMK